MFPSGFLPGKARTLPSSITGVAALENCQKIGRKIVRESEIPNNPDFLSRLDTKTMFKVREWERFQFAIDYEHQQVLVSY